MNTMNRAGMGLAAGFAATVPMTAYLIAGYESLPNREQYPLPPHEITMNAAHDAHLDENVQTTDAQLTATLAAHFGYGSATGAIYALTAHALPLPPLVKGGLFGLSLWCVSYLEIMPRLGWHRPIQTEPAARTAMMLSSNIFWGAVTGVLCDAWEKRQAYRQV